VTSHRRLAFRLACLSLLIAAPLAAQPAPDPSDTAPLAQPAEPEIPAEPEVPAAPENAAPAMQPPAPDAPMSPEAPPVTAGPPAEVAEPEMAAPAVAPEPAPAVAEPAAPSAPVVAEPAVPTAPPAPVIAEPAAPPAPPTPVVAEPAPPPAPLDPKDVTLRIASAGGAYMKSQELAYFQPFSKRSGYKYAAVTFDGTLASLKAAGASKWDVVDLDQEVAAQACRDGLLESLDSTVVQPGPDGTTATEDFLPGAIQPCAVANTAWSAVMVYDKGLKSPPSKAEHFFDLKKYPGKRALPRTPQHTLEWALLGDGVAPGEVYTQLGTPEGVERAFRKLSAIKDQIVWWDRGVEATDRIALKQAAMGLAFNGRAFMAAVKSRQPIATLWDHQIYHLSAWAIPKGARFAAPAREFIGFATSPGPLADQTRWMPYGPARLSAIKLVGKHAELNFDMKPYLPTSQANLQGALAFDAAWWAERGPALTQRFTAWLEGREIPAEASPTSQ
jgi:putative spermidine/putrescine transport system substrate-binding protein